VNPVVKGKITPKNGWNDMKNAIEGGL